MTQDAREPLFSILLPTHNRADVLPFAIRSVLSQTEQDFELLIVGDGCTDDTARVVAEFQDRRFRWFDLPKGPRFGYGNRNVALRQARGTYVAFMAHDDLWLADHLHLLAECLTEEHVEIAYSRPLWVAPDGTITPSTFNLHHPATLEGFVARKPHSIPAGCVVHRRSCLAKYGYWDETVPYAGDQELWARFIEGGGRRNFAYLPEPTCLHFRAIWKTERNAGPDELDAWRAFHAVEGFTPAEMKIAVDAGTAEQETFWKLIAPDPERWAADLRTAVHMALDQRIALADQRILQTLRHRGSGKRKLQKLAQTGAVLVDDVRDILRWLLWQGAARWRSRKRSKPNNERG